MELGSTPSPRCAEETRMSPRALARPVSLPALILLAAACAGDSPAPATAWPPALGQPFPDLSALDHRGQRVQLSSLRGKVLVIAPIVMSSPACIAYWGGHRHGAFEGRAAQDGLEALESYFPDYAGVELAHPDIAVVQLLLFNAAMQPPTVQDAMRWHRHFQLAARPNHHVLIAPEALRTAAAASVPGFWLVDRDFALVMDATGHRPRHNLYTDLMPAVQKLLARAAAAPGR